MSYINCDDKDKLIDSKEHINASNVHEKAGEDKVKKEEIILYKRRWYAVIVFGYVGFLGNLIWNTWGPISESAKTAFGWRNGDIALLVNWGPITYIISSLFLAWLMDKKGMFNLFLHIVSFASVYGHTE